MIGPSRRQLSVPAVVCILSAVVLAATVIGERAASASSAASPSPVTEVLAIVSPVALPGCSAAGSATLLVPILGGVVQQDLHLPASVSVANLILDAAGPVYVVCGDLPSTPGTQCSLDSSIAAVWPSSLSGDSFVAPSPVGDLVDSVNASLKLLGLPPQAALEKPLSCKVAAVGSPVPAPPGVIPPGPKIVTPLPTTSTGSTPAGAATPLGQFNAASPPISAGPTSPQPTSPSALASTPGVTPQPNTSRGPGLISSITDEVPSSLVAIQIIVAALLALFLIGSWGASGRLAWSDWRRAPGSD